MWNLSYPRIAEQDLAATRARAALHSSIARLPREAPGRHPVREAVGGLLIRAGARLLMPSTPSAPSTVR